MAKNVQEIAGSIKSKVVAIADRQKTLVRAVESERAENQRLTALVAQLQEEIARLKADNEYLTVMRAVSVTPEQAEHSRAMLAGLVRDIDRCIAELKAC